MLTSAFSDYHPWQTANEAMSLGIYQSTVPVHVAQEVRSVWMVQIDPEIVLLVG
jgi:hypothetical protein